MKFTAFSLVVLFILSCAGNDVVPITCSYSPNSAVGLVTNRTWVFRDGYAVSGGATDDFEVRLYEENEIEFTDICNIDPTLLEGIEIRFFVGNEATDIPIGGAHLLFIEDKTFDISAIVTGGGCVRVDAVTDTTISGSITFDSDGDKVDGTWSATKCN